MISILATASPELMDSNQYMVGFVILAAVIFLLNIFDGIRQGTGRKFFSLIGLLLGIYVAYNHGNLLTGILKGWLDYPDFVLTPIGGFILGLVVLGIISLVGILMFKKTKHHEGARRAKNMLGGGLFGAMAGLVCVLLLMICVKMSGTISGIFLANFAQKLEEPPKEGDTLTAEQHKRNKMAVKTLRIFEELNASITDLPGYGIADGFEPIDEDKYRIFDKALQLTQDDAAIERFMAQPGTRYLLEHPSFKKLMEDEEIKELARTRDLHRLLSHPKVKAVTEEPEIQERLKDYDLDAALDAALNVKEVSSYNQDIPEDVPYSVSVETHF